ncbi:MAG: zinc-binding alcohol dehydrogenase [Capsulimonadaceae bacterium]|nr:zinc-binding alcohol dehydrogenase [Capsulimonadaceae bacterium]
MSSSQIVFTGKQQVAYEECEMPVPAAGQILVRNHYTLMSTGTENIVFNRLFDEGTHWDNWVKYPFHPGYSAVGEVAALGEGVTDRTIGQRVAFRGNHRSHAAVAAAETVPIPDALSSKEAAWFALAKIAFMGVRVADYHVGDSVLIIGAGPIGQMSVRWAAAAGLEHIIVADPVASRLKLALAGGATAVIDKPVDKCHDDVLAATGGKLPRIVIDSTGNAAVFDAALTLAADFGRVVILGDTGSPASQKLTSDVIRRGLVIVGAHDGHNDATWNNVTIGRLFFSLAARGRFDLGGLATHVFAPSDAVKAYETANTRRGETMGILFEWDKK